MDGLNWIRQNRLDTLLDRNRAAGSRIPGKDAMRVEFAEHESRVRDFHRGEPRTGWGDAIENDSGGVAQRDILWAAGLVPCDA